MHASQVTSYHGLDGRSYLAVTAKRRYAFRHNTRAEATIEAAPIYAEFEYAPGSGDQVGPLLHEADLINGIKGTTDVLLHGSAHSHRGAVAALSAAVRVGPTAKAVQVWGDRRILLGQGGRLAFTAPEPFTTLPLTWERAYGGRDIYAESKEPVEPDPGLMATSFPAGLGAIAYPRNAHGRGFFIDVDRERLADAPVPNLDDAADPVHPERMLVGDCLDWMDCPVAACFAPIDVFTFPRALFFIPAEFSPPKRPIHEVTTGILSAGELARMEGSDGSPHPRSFNCAPAGLATNRLYGGERVQLWNLHREREMFEFDLPGDRPRLLIEPPGVTTREMEAVLQSVVIEPELDRVTLTWAGAILVAMVYPGEMTEGMRHGVVWPHG